MLVVLAAACASDKETTGPAGPAGEQGPPGVADAPELLAVSQAQAATARHPHVDNALAYGYVSTEECVANPEGEGAMGIHYINVPLMQNPGLDAATPEVLMYAQMPAD